MEQSIRNTMKDAIAFIDVRTKLLMNYLHAASWMLSRIEHHKFVVNEEDRSKISRFLSDVEKEFFPYVKGWRNLEKTTLPTVMHGREVLIQPLFDNDGSKIFCYDCGQKPKYIILEMEDASPEWKSDVPTNYIRSWFWCGECDIGV